MATVSLQSAFDAARRALDAGEAEKAVAVARYVLAYYPRNIEAQRLLGEALLNAGNAEAAAAAFERVLDADPENVAAYYGRGLAFAALDDRMAAVRSFERALEIQPNLAELRTQLIRLYGEAPGSSPQLRLSRAGLARLYTRGGMYGQAVDEFRAIEAESDRPDVEAALAEALWRDGQEDEAAEYCRDTLQRRPALLKPRLLLGYLLYAGGQPEGEELWRAGAQQDPSLSVARGLFDILPPIRLDDPTLPAFDADELVARGYGAEQAEPAPLVKAGPVAELPIPTTDAPPALLVPDDDALPAGTADASTADAGPANDTDDAAAQLEPAPPPRDMLSDDDLLASLLGIDQPQASPSAAPDAPVDDGHTSTTRLSEAEAGATAAPADDSSAQPGGALAPTFSPDEIQAEKVGALEPDGQTQDHSPTLSFGGVGGTDVDNTALEDELDDFELFTLDELAYDEDSTVLPAAAADQAASWDQSATEPTALPARSEPAVALGEQSRSGESDAAPFDELPAPREASAPEADEPVPEPGATRDLFSLDDLADDAASWEQEQPISTGDEEQMPFSLADLGIDADELSSLQPGSTASQPRAGDTPAFGWETYAPDLPASPAQDVPGSGRDLDAAEPAARAPVATPGGRQAEATSFSLADLGLTDEEIAALDLNDEPADQGALPAEHDAPAQGSSPAGESSRHGTPAPTGLRSVYQQLDADPENAALRLAVARLAIQSGDAGAALEQYRHLVRGGTLLDDVSGDLQDLIDEGNDPQLLRRLHRLLGDTFMKQNRIQEAMDQYSWTSERP